MAFVSDITTVESTKKTIAASCTLFQPVSLAYEEMTIPETEYSQKVALTERNPAALEGCRTLTEIHSRKTLQR